MKWSMRLDKKARRTIRGGLALATFAFFFLSPASEAFTVIFLLAFGLFLLSGRPLDLLFPIDPGEE